MTRSVAVIIPTLGRKSLFLAIASALSQTICPDHIYVVDDSLEQNVSVETDTRVQILRTGGLKGPSVARNLAIGLNSSDWIAFLDDDDYWYQNHLEKLLAFILTNNLDAAYSSAIVRGKKRPQKIYDGKHDPLVDIYSKSTWKKTQWYFPTPGLLISKEIAAHLPFNENLKEREDLWFAHKIYEYQFKMAQSSDPTVVINQDAIRSIHRTTLETDIEWFERLELVNKDASINFFTGVAFRNAVIRRDWRSIVYIAKAFPSEKSIFRFIARSKKF